MSEKQTRVLVVEDDAAVRNLVVTALGLNGYEAMEAADGTRAGALISSAMPDVVLLDLGLPDMDGVELVNRVRT